MIIGRISGDGALLLRLSSMSIRVRDALRTGIHREGFRLLRYVKEEKLSGQVLKNRTGTLRRKINFEATETAQYIGGSVGVKLSYAAAHEYGIDKMVTVRAHVRETAHGSQNVREFERHMHLPERSFLRSSLRENAESIRENLKRDVIEALLAS